MTKPSADDLAHAPRLKIERAKQHIRDLSGKINAFLAERPFKFVVRHQPKAKRMTYLSKRDKPIPDTFALIAGDAIHNLCSALDLTIYNLAADKAPDDARRALMFPFAGKPERLDHRIQSTQVHFAGTYVVETIRNLQPYPGGNQILCGLHELNSRDKHRLLILTERTARVDASDLPLVLPGHPITKYGLQSAVWFDHASAEELVFYEVLGVDYFDQIKARGSDADFEIEANVQPPFLITFGEGQPFEFQPVVAQLNVCANSIEKTVSDLIAAFFDPKNIR
jgi:hypothetical protein